MSEVLPNYESISRCMKEKIHIFNGMKRKLFCLTEKALLAKQKTKEKLEKIFVIYITDNWLFSPI